MTNTALGINSNSGSPTFAALAFRQAMSSALYNGTSRILGGRSGYGRGRQPATLTATSTTWTIGAFAAIIDPAFTSSQGAYFCATDANNTGSITAADATNPRIDILYAQVNDTDVDSSTLRSFTVNYLAGTPAASPSAPATPARSFVLATINVPHSGAGSPTIAVNNTFEVAAGGILPCSSSAGYPATPLAGDWVDDLALGYSLRYNGTAWIPASGDDTLAVTPTLLNSWVSYDAGVAFGIPQYRKRNGIVYLSGLGKNGTVGVAWFFLPAGSRPLKQKPFIVNSNTGLARVDIIPSGSVQVNSYLTGGSNAYVSLDSISFVAEQ